MNPPTHMNVLTTPVRTLAPAILLVTLMAGCSGSTQLVGTPKMYTLAGAADPFVDVPEALRTSQIRVLYATDRAVEKTEDGKREFGFKRSMSLEVGYVTVDMGEEMTWDNLVAASRSAKRQSDIPIKVSNVTLLGSYPVSNRAPVLINGVPSDTPETTAAVAETSKAVHATLRETLVHTKRKEVFLYVHGYNNTFDEAAIRMAMLWHFMGREGVPVIYSWPAGSGGVLRGYSYDRESGEFTVFHLKEFLTALADCPDVEKINIVAHSRGTDVTVTALRELNLKYKHHASGPRARLKMGHIVLAAPDMDWEVFNQRAIAERVGAAMETFTLYVSDHDRALALSDWLYQGVQRLGRLANKDVSLDMQHALKQMKGRFSVIDVKADTGFLGHAYFVESPEVLSDLILALRDRKLPGAEHGRPLVERDDGFWEIHNGYPEVTPGKE